MFENDTAVTAKNRDTYTRWTSHNFAGIFSGVTDDELTPFGRIVETARLDARLSARKAADAAGISDARWRQIVKGWQPAGAGNRIPVTTTPKTVIAMAKAVGLSVPTALTAAGFSPNQAEPDPRPVGQTLQDVVDELADATPEEIARIRAYVQGIKDSRG